jgi:hypothetical protein
LHDLLLSRRKLGHALERLLPLRVSDEEVCDLVLLGDAPAGSFRRWLPKAIGLSVATVAGKVAQLASVPVVVIK